VIAAAVRARVVLVILLLVFAAGAWWRTVDVMQGMDDGPWTTLGSLGWFLGVWVVMMAAMMLPSAAPTVALHSHLTRDRSPHASLVFAGGYLLAWTAAGALAFGVAAAGRATLGDVLAWDRAGRWAAALTLVAAGVYQLTPLKDVCLTRCRSPLGSLTAASQGGSWGALRSGARIGAWCIGCCWALMASLFALGIMSLAWTAAVAALVAAEKLLPRRRVATCAGAAILFALGVLVLTAPGSVPALTIPGMPA
jgi:predicted metal-binding membrane protein